ncbi:hypothetical protein [Gluconobacter oxydans]|uniref:hypothetical protein n=1 Tax=Gluconobacter oxydans TaxID=442 RepID=UPI0039EC0538
MPHIDPRVNEIYLALGEFVMKFAEVENQLRIVCFDLLGANSSGANVIAHEMGVMACNKFIRRVHKWNGEILTERADLTLKHLELLLEERNNIFHNGIIETKDGFVCRKFLTMPLAQKYKETLVTVTDFSCMIHDLEVILRSLSVLRFEFPPSVIPASGPLLDRDFLKAFQLPLPPPWLRKPTPTAERM